MKLRPNQFCPIHKSLSCCGRETLPKPRLVRLGVQQIEDSHHPRRYRELRSPAEMRKLMNRKIGEQNGICPICHKEFTDYNDVVPDHKNPKGMGGAWRDDHPDNIQATHWWCNEEKDQPEWMADGPSVLLGLKPLKTRCGSESGVPCVHAVLGHEAIVCGLIEIG